VAQPANSASKGKQVSARIRPKSHKKAAV